MLGKACTWGAALIAAASMAAAEAPLSAIDWLDDAVPVIGPVDPNVGAPDEPPVTGATVPSVSVGPITDSAGQDVVGLLSTVVTGLPEAIWAASSGADFEALVAPMDLHNVPALQELLYTLMLSEARPPIGLDAEAFLTLRARKLAEFGAVEPAEALAERLPLKTPAHFELWFDLTLLAGLEDKACAALAKNRALSADYAAQSFCAMRQGNWDEAALILDSAAALGLLSRSEERLLSAFLDPEYAENTVALAPPRDVTPLEFRLHEAIGRPLPTVNLPIAYAVADLRDLAGWKAQLEAAERLVRVRAYSPNALLGLYTERKPAASGGVWERARAIQSLEAALEDGGAEAVSAALIGARAALEAVGLEIALAEIYVPELRSAVLTEEGARARFELTLLTKAYERAEGQGPAAAFLTSLAKGAPEGAERLNDTLAEAIEDGFSNAAPRAHLEALMRSGKLGEAILVAAREMARGLDGDFSALRSGLAGLRQMGLEDVARRAALQMFLARRDV